MNPHVCQVITRLDALGGAQIHLLHLARALRRRGWRVTVAGGGRGSFTDLLTAEGIDWLPLADMVHPIAPGPDARALRGLEALLARLEPDLVAAHSSKAGFLARLAARRRGLPAVFTAHGWAFTPGVPSHRRLLALAAERLAGRWARRIICVSEFDRRLALRWRVAPAERLVTVHNGIPDAAPRARPGAPGPARLVMTARFEPPKDHATLLRALAGLSHPWELDLIGDGPDLPAARRLAGQLGIGERVRFLGPRTDVADLLAGGRAFVLTSRWEGLPLTVLEAMRAGLPVVATAVGGVPEAVADGETGFLVPPGDVAALRDRLARLLGDPALRARMGAAGRRRFEARFTLEGMVARTEAVYRQALAAAGGSRREVG